MWSSARIHGLVVKYYMLLRQHRYLSNSLHQFCFTVWHLAIQWTHTLFSNSVHVLRSDLSLTTDFFGVKRKIWWSSQGLVTYQSHARCFAQFFLSSIIHWSLSKRRHRNKSSCSLLNRVQSSRSKLTTFLNTGSQLRFQSNRVSAQTPIEQGVCSDSNQTATSDGCVQKLGIISGN